MTAGTGLQIVAALPTSKFRDRRLPRPLPTLAPQPHVGIKSQPSPREKDRQMPAKVYTRPTASLPPPTNLLLTPTPPIAPLTPPVHVVDLMTPAGSAVFGAVWRGQEAKVVECPALSDSMPEFKTTYDVEPHAELLGFDDASWPTIAADDLGARRGGGMI